MPPSLSIASSADSPLTAKCLRTPAARPPACAAGAWKAPLRRPRPQARFNESAGLLEFMNGGGLRWFPVPSFRTSARTNAVPRSGTWDKRTILRARFMATLGQPDPRVGFAVRLVEASGRLRITAADLARVAGLSPSRSFRLVARRTEITPAKHLRVIKPSQPETRRPEVVSVLRSRSKHRRPE